jgi:rubredoxin
MAWRCPACGIQIHHSPIEARPRPGHRYRCHICRLELQIDEQTNKLTVTRFESDRDVPPRGKPSDP